jgi:predicted transcriptional regulator
MTTDTINSIRSWSSKLDDFASFLNDPSSESLHKILADGDRAGSLLRGVTRKASDSITRIAGEEEKLKEILNTYIITAPKKLRDTEQLKAGG